MGAMLGVLLLSGLIFRKSVRPGWFLASIGAIIVGLGAWARGYGWIHEPAVFDQLSYPWFDYVLLGAVSIAIILAMPDGWRRSGMTLRHTGPGVPWALGLSLALCGFLTYTAVADVFGSPEFELEPVAFNAFASVPVEELFFRGVIVALMLEAFGARRTLLRAEMNWGLIPAAVVFGFGHLTSVSGGEEIVINYFQTLWTVFGGFVLVWLRVATGSLLLPFAVHLYGNLIHFFI
ncbi:CPBP family intramembrane glutamic endopeptidase [Marinicauda salina]|nr:CPBP family intramembrane glutamic endopeptidase [Marinicauda salina]